MIHPADRDRILWIAEAILHGRHDVVSGCRTLVATLKRAKMERDPDARSIVAVDACTDHIPSEGSRHLWDAKAFAEATAGLDDYAAKMRERVFADCRALIRKLTPATACTS